MGVVTDLFFARCRSSLNEVAMVYARMFLQLMVDTLLDCRNAYHIHVQRLPGCGFLMFSRVKGAYLLERYVFHLVIPPMPWIWGYDHWLWVISK